MRKIYLLTKIEMKNKPLHFYKKNKVEQLKAFCTVVECGSSITKASKELKMTASSVSMKIQSLEYELQKTLFNRKGKRLKLNDAGLKYYHIARQTINQFYVAYQKDYNIKNPILETCKINLHNKFIFIKNFLCNLLKKMLIKITLKRFFTTIGIFFSCILIFLHQTNYFFDVKLKKLANPLLKEVMNVGYYKIKPTECPKESYQIYVDIGSLMLHFKDKKDVSMFYFTNFPCPPTPRRMSGINDPKILNESYIPCDTQNRIEGYKRQYEIENILLQSKNFSQFVFYKKELPECIGYDAYFENLAKYKDSLIAFKIADKDLIEEGAFWVIKNKRYYYILLEQNGKQPVFNLKQEVLRYIVFRKLTLSELMEYDKGVYWKLIKDYNIKM